MANGLPNGVILYKILAVAFSIIEKILNFSPDLSDFERDNKMSNHPNTVTIQPQPRPKGPVIVWWHALLYMLAGSVITILLLVLWIAFFTGVPATNTPLTPPPTSGKPDLTAELSQEYVNREIAAYLNKSPVSVLGIVQVKQVVVQFSPDSVLDANIRISALGRQLDINIKDKVEVRGNQLTLSLKENPKVEGLGLPTATVNGALDQINANVASQLNQLVASVGMAKDCTTGKPLGRVPTLLALDLQPGVLHAQFSINIAT